MPERQSPGTGLPTAAVFSGTFLSGAMMSLSLLAVPVLLDTVTSGPLLIEQWHSLYHYGHRIAPGLSIATCSLYTLATFRRRKKRRSWLRFAFAALLTFTMIPFTLTIMAPTNNTLFALQAQQANGLGGSTALSHAQDLVSRWRYLHLVRSFFPLIGALVGLSAVRGES
ncbi:unnamed protein product [Cercospora beticola]|nr:unnamed protein product [Cercospora beticola]